MTTSFTTPATTSRSAPLPVAVAGLGALLVVPELLQGFVYLLRGLSMLDVGIGFVLEQGLQAAAAAAGGVAVAFGLRHKPFTTPLRAAVALYAAVTLLFAVRMLVGQVPFGATLAYVVGVPGLSYGALDLDWTTFLANLGCVAWVVSLVLTARGSTGRVVVPAGLVDVVAGSVAVAPAAVPVVTGIGTGSGPAGASAAGALQSYTGPAIWPRTEESYPGPPADLGRRFVARLVDGLVVVGMLVVVSLVLQVFGSDPTGGAGVFAGLVALAALTAMVAYEPWLLARSGQTVGRRALGIRVVHLDGSRVGGAAAATRSLMPAAANLLTCGFASTLFALSPLFDGGPYRRGWHDKIARTVTVRVVPQQAVTR